MYSQNDEEKYIIEFFKGQSGCFLDIGAWNGKTFSNTHQLALQGWYGVCIEPSPSVTDSLEQLYWGNNKIKILKVGVGIKRGILPFYDFDGDAIGTFDRKHAELWRERANTKWKEIEVEVIAVNDLFIRMGYDFSFINIDAEGWSFLILQRLPFIRLTKLRMICVEFDHHRKEILDFVGNYGFKLLHQTAENLLLVKK